ncbi:triphosphoribosyl-dephospho-CoA synthase [Streptomyces umbrinus]|uniref:triphosphoribosyl-dephospho-CoA synthase n=1 Tax=Streptomyces umbrinus TaxID=67370 RepID=UPI003C2E0DD7
MTTPLVPAPPPRTRNHRSAHALADTAVRALAEEAELTPKPGLVDARGPGAHTDMNLATMLRSAESLRGAFTDMAQAAQHFTAPTRELRETLADIGRDGERAMLDATGGVNTHRGAIWALGLLVAAAVIEGPYGPEPTEPIARTAGTIAALPDRNTPALDSNGLRAAARYGASGARGEAIGGFPHALFALRALRTARIGGASEPHARLDALVTVVASLDDTCLLHRGGREGLAMAQRGARAVLADGGSATSRGRAALGALDLGLVRAGLSPGGSADLLAAALFLDRTTSPDAIPSLSS